MTNARPNDECETNAKRGEHRSPNDCNLHGGLQLVWLFPEGRDTTAVPVPVIIPVIRLASGQDTRVAMDLEGPFRQSEGWDGASDGLATN